MDKQHEKRNIYLKKIQKLIYVSNYSEQHLKEGRFGKHKKQVIFCTLITTSSKRAKRNEKM